MNELTTVGLLGVRGMYEVVCRDADGAVKWDGAGTQYLCKYRA
jgi:hypothetical protein